MHYIRRLPEDFNKFLCLFFIEEASCGALLLNIGIGIAFIACDNMSLISRDLNDGRAFCMAAPFDDPYLRGKHPLFFKKGNPKTFGDIFLPLLKGTL